MTLTGDLQQRLSECAALWLWELAAIQANSAQPFRLASGNFSPLYVNCRRVISDPAFMQLFCATGRRLLERAGVACDVVAGGETAGIPFAAYLANALGQPLVYVRKQAKAHGLANRVEGHLAAGADVLLVEDLITDGGSKASFLAAIAAAGGQVRHVLVLFDRQQGGREQLAQQGITLSAVTDRSTALAVGVAAGFLSAADCSSISAYFADVAAWHRERGLVAYSTDPR